jgi:hypothetical protein
MPRATTVRFTDEMFARLDQASARTGMPVNSIVIAACLEWMQRHTPAPGAEPGAAEQVGWEPRGVAVPPRWATLRRAVEVAVGKRATTGIYPFERFSSNAKKLLTMAQTEALKAGFSYIGTEHMLIAAFSEADFQSAKILAAMSIEEGAVRTAIDKAIGRHQTKIPTRIVPTSRVKIVIELAFKLCAAAGDPKVSTGHLLLALAAEGQGIAAHVLKDMGATKLRVEAALGSLTEPEV